MPTARYAIPLALSVLLVLSGCAEPPAQRSEPAPEAEGFPVSVSGAHGEITLRSPPERIVSLSPTTTEMLFAIGAGDQVVAADEHSDFPPEAPTTELSGFTPNVEAITGYDPDLVVVSRDAGETISQLESVEVTTLAMPAATDIDDTYEQLRTLGKATGHLDAAIELTDEIAAELDRIVADTPEPEEGLAFYHELDDSMYTVTSDTYIGQIYALFELENIADAAEDTGEGYPQLSPEFVVDHDPDIIFLSYPGGQERIDTIEERPAFGRISAVENGNVVPLDPDVSSRWGPRVVDFARSVGDAVETAVAAE